MTPSLCGSSDPASQNTIDAVLAEHGTEAFAAHFLRAVGPTWAPALIADFTAPQTNGDLS